MTCKFRVKGKKMAYDYKIGRFILVKKYGYYFDSMTNSYANVLMCVSQSTHTPKQNDKRETNFFFSFFFLLTHTQLLVFWFVEAVSQTTLATVMPVKVASHENSSTTLIRRTLSTKSANFAIFIHLIVFQHSQLNLLPLMLVLLGSGVRLLPFLSTTKSQHKMKGRLLCLTLEDTPL